MTRRGTIPCAAAAAAALILAAGCRKETTMTAEYTTTGAAPPAGSYATGAVAMGGPGTAETRTYVFYGVPTRVDSASNVVTIDHERIEGYMDAMTMTFRVDDPVIIERIHAGERTQFAIRVDPGGAAVVTAIGDEAGAMRVTATGAAGTATGAMGATGAATTGATGPYR